jgi:hypothetical protein
VRVALLYVIHVYRFERSDRFAVVAAIGLIFFRIARARFRRTVAVS